MVACARGIRRDSNGGSHGDGLKSEKNKSKKTATAARVTARESIGLRAGQKTSSDATVDIGRLLDLVAAFSRQTICVVGDFVLDEFVSGEISRVSREAPVLILRHRRTESYPGGAANAVNNLADLGARVLPVGVVGEDAGGRKLLEYFRAKNINVSGVLQSARWITTTKTRYLAGWTHTTEQQVLRVDREPEGEVPANLQAQIARKARQAARGAAAVLISDYGLGAASPSLVRSLHARRITLDSRYRLLEYRNAGVTAATPNEPEIEAAYHSRVGNDIGKLDDFGQRARRDLSLEALVVTRGKDGMAIFEPNQPTRHLPVYGSDAPVDVTGAGDTVIAVFTLALAAGATYLEAAHLANYAGGIVVMKRCTATVTRAELEAALRHDATADR
jgi:rfaE bifunctional protein kinase chain/domain